MDRTSTPARSPARRPGGRLRTAAAALALAATVAGSAWAADVPPAGLVDLGQADPRLEGFRSPAGFKLDLVADDSLLESPVALTFDDSGRFYVAESSAAERTFDVWESVPLGDGSTIRLHRRHRGTTDTIKRLTDTDADGRFDAAEVVVEGIEQPTALLWLKGALYVTALGRLERWNDGDGDGRFETRTVLLDGFGALDARGLNGLTLGNDGFLYLTSGDNDTHAFNPAGGGSRIDLARAGGLWRCRPDGTDLQLVAAGFRNPRGGVAFDANLQPILLDDDGADGSRLAGVRLIQPTEGGDYGWRALPDAPGTPDLELGAVDGDRPGKLAGFGLIGSGSPSSFVISQGVVLPDACRGLLIATDPGRHAIRGFKVAQEGATLSLAGETTLLTADDRFRPDGIIVGADNALYFLDRPDPVPSPADRDAKPTRPGGRIYRLTSTTVTPPIRNWDQVTSMIHNDLLFKALPGLDYGGADRALRELVERGAWTRNVFLTFATNATQPVHLRLLGIQGARQLWNDEAETFMVTLLADPLPEIRRLAAQVLALEPKRAEARLVPKLLERLEDSDGRVIRAVVLALARHAEANPRQPAAALVRWLYAHPQADPATRDAVIRGIERLGDVGVDEVALAVRTRRGVERETAVRLYSTLRTAHAAEELAGLIQIPDLSSPERAILIRQFADFSPSLDVSTTALVDWLNKHPEVEPLGKRIALATCRLVGNPASTLVLACLDDDDESVRIAATHFAARTRPPGAMAKLGSRLGDDARSAAERLAVAQGLRLGGAAGFAALDAAYLGSDSPAIRRATLRSMADADRTKALPALTSTLSGPDPLLRAEAIGILGETPAGALALGQAYLDATLTRSDLPGVLRGLRAHDTKEVRPILAAVKKHATQGMSALSASALRIRAVESGNPWSGLDVFSRASSRCSTCHQVGGKGGESGPRLDLDAHGLTAEQLIDAIYRPDHAIKPGYEPARLALADKKGSGKNEPTGSTRLTKPTAPLAGVDRSPIASDPARHPVMPAGLDLDLTPQELADLVAFLLDPTVQAAVKGGGIVPVDHWVVAGPFAPGADSLRLPLDRVDPTKTLAGADGQGLHWLPLTAARSGLIDLGGLLRSDPSQAYAAAQVRTATPQTGWLYASSCGPARIYLNGSKVAELPDRSTWPSDAGAADLTRLPLKAGWNLILVAFEPPAGGPPHASFRIGGPKAIEIRAARGPEGTPR